MVLLLSLVVVCGGSKVRRLKGKEKKQEGQGEACLVPASYVAQNALHAAGSDDHRCHNKSDLAHQPGCFRYSSLATN